MDPEMLAANAASTPAPNQSATPQAPPPEAAVDEGPEDESQPLSQMDIEGAENDGHIVTHHPKVSDRIKAMGYGKPRRHAIKNDDDLAEHIKRHAKRLHPKK